MKSLFKILLIFISVLIISCGEKIKDTNADNSSEIVEDSAIENLDQPEEEAELSAEIPQGKFTYELFFAEFGGRVENEPVEVEIIGNWIVVYGNEKLTDEEIIVEGMLLRHKSGEWIIAQDESQTEADEIGGCTDGPPTIDLETGIIGWC